MKKQIIPLPNVVLKDLSLPQIIYQSTTATVTLKELNDDDIEEVFGIHFKRINENSFQYESLRHSVADQQTVSDLAESKLQIMLDASTELEGSELREQVDFAIKIVVGRGNDYSAVWTDFDTGGGWGFLRSGGNTASARRKK